MTLREAVAEAATLLSVDPHLIADARRDAETLLLHTLQITHAQLLANPVRQLTPREQALYQESISRRLRHEPIQYITGRQEFYGLALCVTPAVLIPRPETELLVEAILSHFKPRADAPLRIADVGTGSGAIAIALAVHLPHAEITAIDISPEALKIAEENAMAHNLARRIRFLQADLLALPISRLPQSKSVQSQPFEHFDAIVSNPPYVPSTEAPELHPQVRDYEPALALFAGPAGLDIYRRLIPLARAALQPDGLLALEIGYNQRDAIAALLANWRNVTFLDDLQRIPRAVLAQR